MEASPASVAKSDSYEAMCLYHRAAFGYLSADGADDSALKQATSAWVGAYLDSGARRQRTRFRGKFGLERAKPAMFKAMEDIRGALYALFGRHIQVLRLLSNTDQCFSSCENGGVRLARVVRCRPRVA